MKTTVDVFSQASRKILEVLLEDGASYQTTLHKKADITYSHICNIIKTLEQANLLTTKRQGRIKICSLTTRGMEISILVQKINRLMSKG